MNTAIHFLLFIGCRILENRFVELVLVVSAGAAWGLGLVLMLSHYPQFMACVFVLFVATATLYLLRKTWFAFKTDQKRDVS